jgi:hypothetical protein
MKGLDSVQSSNSTIIIIIIIIMYCMVFAIVTFIQFLNAAGGREGGCSTNFRCFSPLPMYACIITESYEALSMCVSCRNRAATNGSPSG